MVNILKLKFVFNITDECIKSLGASCLRKLVIRTLSAAVVGRFRGGQELGVQSLYSAGESPQAPTKSPGSVGQSLIYASLSDHGCFPRFAIMAGAVNFRI